MEQLKNEAIRDASEEVSQEFKTLIKDSDLETLKQLQHTMSALIDCLGMEQLKKEAIKDASEEVSQEFKTLVKDSDLETLKQLQHTILGRLQDSNAVLSHFNEYSENCFGEVSPDFSRNTRLLKSMKSDLDYIFQKLRNMKAKILAAYPDAFPDEGTQEALDRRPDLEMG